MPAECSFDFEFRTLPGHESAPLLRELQDFAERELLPEMRAVAATSGFAWTELSGFPGLETPGTADVVSLGRQLAGTNDVVKVSFGTEAGLYHEDGIPAIVCGPGSIRQAHKADEFIALEQVARCEAFLLGLRDRLAAR